MALRKELQKLFVHNDKVIVPDSYRFTNHKLKWIISIKEYDNSSILPSYFSENFGTFPQVIMFHNVYTNIKEFAKLSHSFIKYMKTNDDIWVISTHEKALKSRKYGNIKCFKKT
uniref:Uncharacterized protein n=1 Tax=viral metagenome TaxID=1070528 RepID=A0A6C0CJN5_9ZZZZ